LKRQRHIPVIAVTVLFTHCRIRLQAGSLTASAVLVLSLTPSLRAAQTSAKHDHPPTFAYVGGTEHLPESCRGTLQLTPGSLTFKCAQQEVVIPYRAIDAMQYRGDVIRRIRKLKVKWAVPPPQHTCHGKNCYFTLLYRSDGVHVVILDVSPEQMRPYLAEIDLQAGRRVEVQSHESYGP
jgi:hypothetical protein